MANHLYGHGPGYGVQASLSSSHLGSANPCLPGTSLMSPSWNPSFDPLPAAVDSAKYPALEKYSTSLYLNHVAGLSPTEAGAAAYGSYPGKAAGGAAPTPPVLLQFAGAVEPSWLPGMKRPSEDLYHQTILGDLNNIGQSKALFSTNSFTKRPRNDNARHLPYPQRPGEKVCHPYMLTRTCKYGDNCKFDHPLWVPEGGIPGWTEGPHIIPPAFLPQRPGVPDCPYARCTFGLQCKFNHPENKVSETNGVSIMPPSLLHNMKGLPLRPGEQDCPFYLKTGSCKYGALCRFSHPEINGYVASSATGLPNGVINPAAALPLNMNPYFTQTAVGVSATVYPQRPGQIVCDFYMKTGECKFGERCKFHHPIDRSAPAPTVGKQTVQQDIKLSLSGLPRREGTMFCRDYMNTGTCAYGAACQYDHPTPAEAIAKTIFPVSTFGSGAATAEEE